MSETLFPEVAEAAPQVARFSTHYEVQPKQTLRIGERLKAADSVSDHDHCHGDFDQDGQ